MPLRTFQVVDLLVGQDFEQNDRKKIDDSSWFSPQKRKQKKTKKVPKRTISDGLQNGPHITQFVSKFEQTRPQTKGVGQAVQTVDSRQHTSKSATSSAGTVEQSAAE